MQPLSLREPRLRAVQIARGLLALLALAIAASCSGSGSTSAPPAGSSEEAAKPAAGALDLGAVMARVRLAWRAGAAGEWIGGGRTYGAVASEARLQVTPRAAEKAPIAFETTAIGRGAITPPARGAARVDEDGRLAIARGEAVEQLENTDEGVHQSFRFEREPSGSGDLVVRVRVTGAEHAGETSEGHHFRAAAGVEVLYGKATWVDARGVETAMEVRHEGGELALVVPAKALAEAVYPAQIDPVISTRIDVNQVVIGDARLNQDQPAAAFDGTNYLVVWQDSRAIDENYSKVYGARVTSAGVVLDPGGIEIFSSGPGGRPPSVAFDGTNYLVVIADNSGNIRGNRVAPSGAVLDGGSGKNIGTTSAYVQEVQVAFGTTTYLVVWSTHTDYSADIKGRLVDKNGAGVGAAFTICSSTGGQTLPRLAFDGTNYLVVWEDRRSFSIDIYGSRVSATGTVLDPNGIAITTIIGDQTWPSVAFDGTNYLVAWQSSTSTSNDVVAARVDPNGTLLDPAGIPVSATSASTDVEPRVAFDGQSFLILWSHYVSAFGATYDVWANRVSSAGAALDGTGAPVSAAAGQQRKPWPVCGSAGCLAVWEDGRGGSVDVYGARMAAGAPLDTNGIHVSTAASEQTKPGMTFGNGMYFVVWEDRRTGANWQIYGTRVDTAGNVLDPAGIPIAEGAYDHHDPRVAASNGGFLVVWWDLRNSGPGYTYNDVFAARVTPAGAVLDPGGFALTSDKNDDDLPVVASDGTGYLVAWHDAYGPGVNDRIHATRVDAAGNVLDAATPIQPVVSGASNPALTFGGGQYFLVWSGTRGVRISTAGAVLDAAPGISVGPGDYPSVGFDGQSYVAAYRRYVSGGAQIWASRVSVNGTALDPAGITLSTANVDTYTSAWYRLGPEVAFDGVDSVITWAGPPASGTVYGAWFTPAGKVIGSSALVTSTAAAIHSTAIASQGDGHHSLVAYAFGDPATGVRNYRIKANIVTAKANGDACALSAECKSNFCVDGVCCNTACGGSQTDCQACSVAAGAPVDGTCAPLSGTTCSDGNACTQNDTCSNGTCVGGAPVVCAALDACHAAGTCQPATGLCTNPAKPDGTACDDGDGCTQTDKCQAGACVGTNAKTCAAPDACHQPGTCVPATGTCTYAPKADGTACSDGDACTNGDSCQAGACVPGTPTVCAPPAACKKPGVCNPTSGQCTYANEADGTGCSDGDACTQTDTCQGGACVGKSPVTCPAPNDCTEVGTCDTATGQCTFTPKPDGTACDDGNPCTQGDACQAGSCVAGAPKACPAPAACHEAGVCDVTNGQCVYAASPDGASCDDGDACTQTDACQGGACVGSDPVVCAAQDECHGAGTCASATGQCSNPKLPDGTPCSIGACQGGACSPNGTGGSGGAATTGTGGAGGASSSATSSSGGGQSPASSSSSSGGKEPNSQGGCGCRTTAPTDSPAGGAALFVALGLLMRRRRVQNQSLRTNR
jgi:MYXO-CTERM domain-containing protein